MGVLELYTPLTTLLLHGLTVCAKVRKRSDKSIKYNSKIDNKKLPE